MEAHPAAAAPQTDSRLVVVMFTDLVGSTSLKAKVGLDGYKALFDRHETLFGQALAALGADRELYDNGDGYLAVFKSPRRAVRVALLFQYLMRREPWAEPFAFRVGLHQGEVDQGLSRTSGVQKLFGATVDLGARVTSLGIGGQILMTRAVFEGAKAEVREHPPIPDDPAFPAAPLPPLRWVPHGLYLFNGFTDALEVFEVGAEGVAPFVPPADSEKGKRVRFADGARSAEEQAAAAGGTSAGGRGRVGRRRWLAVAGVAAVVLAGVGAAAVWLKRPDPLADMRRREIEQEVAAARAEQPPTARAHPSDAVYVPAIKPANNEAFQVLSDHRTIDMRDWKEVPADRQADYYSAVSTIRRTRLKKVAEAGRFEVEFRTSGLDVFPRGLDAFATTTEVQTVDTLLSTERMKVRKLSTDVADVPVGAEFQLRTASTAWNSCQTEQEQWFGALGYKGAFKLSMLILLPPNKPYKSVACTVAPTSKAVETPYDGPRIVVEAPDHDWVYWEVPDPAAGNVYRLHWKW
jgi:class 3 adenylate cyclase